MLLKNLSIELVFVKHCKLLCYFSNFGLRTSDCKAQRSTSKYKFELTNYSLWTSWNSVNLMKIYLRQAEVCTLSSFVWEVGCDATATTESKCMNWNENLQYKKLSKCEQSNKQALTTTEHYWNNSWLDGTRGWGNIIVSRYRPVDNDRVWIS